MQILIICFTTVTSSMCGKGVEDTKAGSSNRLLMLACVGAPKQEEKQALTCGVAQTLADSGVRKLACIGAPEQEEEHVLRSRETDNVRQWSLEAREEQDLTCGASSGGQWSSDASVHWGTGTGGGAEDVRRSTGSGGQWSPDVSMRQGPRTRGEGAGSVGQWGLEVGVCWGIRIKIKLKVELGRKRGFIDKLKF